MAHLSAQVPTFINQTLNSTEFLARAATGSASSSPIAVLAVGALVGAGATLLAQKSGSVLSHRLRSILSKPVTAIYDLAFKHGLSGSYEDAIPLNSEQVIAKFNEGTWQRQAFDDYVSVLLNEDDIFPCVYATRGYKANNQLFHFISSDDLSDPTHIRSLAKALSLYLPQSRSLGPNTSLVLLAKQPTDASPARSMDEYNDSFWKLLDGLARLDKTPWPSSIPRDIDTDRWCFCFGGEPFFSVIQTPAHQVRRSRYAKGVTIVFQPKWIFDILFSTNEKRVGALSKVRGLLKLYESIPVSPELKNYGEDGSRESRQYFLLDENEPASCAFEKLAD